MKLYIAVPAYGCTMTNSFLTSLLYLRQECQRRGLACAIDFIGNESLITRARNLLVEKFLRTPDATHLLFIDSDIAFHPDSVFALIETNKDVTCVVYPKKGYDWGKLKDTTRNPGEPLHQKCLDFNINVDPTSIQQTDHLIRVLDAATGFMMIKREVLERMKRAYTPSLECVNDVAGYDIDKYVALFDCLIDPVSRRYLSEDFAFCRRWQKLGGEIWVDLRFGLGHEGSLYFHDGLERSFDNNNVSAQSQ